MADAAADGVLAQHTVGTFQCDRYVRHWNVSSTFNFNLPGVVAL